MTDTERATLQQRIAELERELTNAQANNHQRNVELDALHYVWCDGGCKGGVHRFGEHPPLTAEIVAAAKRNTRRLESWFVNSEGRKGPPTIMERIPFWSGAKQAIHDAYVKRTDAEINALTAALKERKERIATLEWELHMRKLMAAAVKQRLRILVEKEATLTATLKERDARIAELERENERLATCNAGANQLMLTAIQEVKDYQEEQTALTAALKTAREALKQIVDRDAWGVPRWNAHVVAQDALQAIDKADGNG